MSECLASVPKLPVSDFMEKCKDERLTLMDTRKVWSVGGVVCGRCGLWEVWYVMDTRRDEGSFNVISCDRLLTTVKNTFQGP